MFESGFPEYYYIANSTVDDQFMQVITAGNYAEDPLYLLPMTYSLTYNQLWIFRQPDSTSNNPYFIVMSAKTGLDMNVYQASTTPGAYVQVFDRQNRYNEQVCFFY